MTAMKISEAERIIRIYMERKKPVMIWGPPGIGKSDLIRKIAKDMGYGLVDIRLADKQEGDLLGMPHIIKTPEGDETVIWVTPEFLPKEKNGRTVIFLDEINNAPPSVQKTAYELVLDRKIGSYKVPVDAIIVAAGNRTDQDGANVHDMAAPLRDRFGHIEICVDAGDWITWAYAADINPWLVSYIKWKGEGALHNYNEDNEEISFSSPRSLAILSKLLEGFDVTDMSNIKLIQQLGHSKIGAIATEFCAFVKLSAKFDLEKLIANPTKEKIPDDMEIQYALCSALVEYAKKNPKKMEAVMEVTARLGVEFQALVFRSLQGDGKDNKMLYAIVETKAFDKMKPRLEKFVIKK
jgi:hypothetical protein